MKSDFQTAYGAKIPKGSTVDYDQVDIGGTMYPQATAAHSKGKDYFVLKNGKWEYSGSKDW